MLTVNNLLSFLTEVKTAIPQIKHSDVIMSDKKFVSKLQALDALKNTVIFAVLPDHGKDGKQDASMWGNYMQFFIFDKTTESVMLESDELTLYNKVQGIAKDFVDRIINTKSGDNRDEGGFNLDCGMFDFFEEDSLQFEAFWDGAQCRGYELNFFLKTK